MAKKDTRRKYNKEFKLKVVREHVEGASLTELSKIYDIAPSTLGTWFANMKDEVIKEVLEKEAEEPTEDVVVDLGTLDQVEELKGKVEVLELKLEDREAEIERLNKKLSQLPKDVKDVNSWVEKVEDLNLDNQIKEAEVKRLEAEVVKLHEIIFMVKEEARREIKTLKDAIVIMAKNYDEE